MTSTVNVGQVATANTFGEWRIQTNLLVDDVNEVARANFVKPTGNVTLTLGRIILANATGTSLDITADARISGKVSVKSFEQDAAPGSFYTDSSDIKFRAANCVFYSNGNTYTRFLYNNTYISAVNVNSTGFIETTGTYANGNLIMNVGGVFSVRSVANSSNVAVLGNISVSNIATIGNAWITLENVTTSNITTANVATLNVAAVGSWSFFSNATIANSSTTNASMSYANVTTRMNAVTANIDTLLVRSLTVSDPISAPSESDSASYRLRVSQTTRGDGAFGVYQGNPANGNAFITFSESTAVWRVTGNSTAGIYNTILTVANISDSISTTSSLNAASLTAVKSAYDTAILAYGAANSAANTVRVSSNTGSTQAKANGINFNNTASIQVTVDAGVNGNANVAFAVVGGTAQGATGAQGTNGAQGTIGSQGTSGTNGIQGSTGLQGLQGVSGTGTQGAVGSQGTTGIQGTTGLQGIQGFVGAQGTTGIQGIQGFVGAQGTTGIQGATGTGIQGSTGPSTAINATNDTSTTTLYPVCVAGSGSNQTPKVRTTATAFTFNASTGVVGATDFSASSDARLKNVLGFIEAPIQILSGINGVRYKWNALAKAKGFEDNNTHVGVLAQEVEVNLPELIDEVGGFKRVSYDRLVPVLIEAIKELNARIKVLEGK